MTEQQIMQRIEEDVNFLETLEYNCIGIFLYGSQNYGVDTETSDVDLKAIVIPKFKDIVYGKRISKVYEREHGHIEVFDLVSMSEHLLKARVNFLEILFTKYYWVKSNYELYIDALRNMAERIAKIDPYRNVQCIYGCYLAYKQRVFKETASNLARINKYGYDNKALSNCLRYANYLSQFDTTMSYKELLVPTNMEQVMEMKRTPPDVQEAKRIVDILDNSTSKNRARLLAAYQSVKDDDTATWLSQLILDCYEYSISKEASF